MDSPGNTIFVLGLTQDHKYTVMDEAISQSKNYNIKKKIKATIFLFPGLHHFQKYQSAAIGKKNKNKNLTYGQN